MLTDPTPIIHQNLRLAREKMSDNKPMEDKGGLLGPRKKMTDKQDDDIMSPAKRVLGYISEIQQKREEIKNG